LPYPGPMSKPHTKRSARKVSRPVKRQKTKPLAAEPKTRLRAPRLDTLEDLRRQTKLLYADAISEDPRIPPERMRVALGVLKLMKSMILEQRKQDEVSRSAPPKAGGPTGGPPPRQEPPIGPIRYVEPRFILPPHLQSQPPGAPSDAGLVMHPAELTGMRSQEKRSKSAGMDEAAACPGLRGTSPERVPARIERCEAANQNVALRPALTQGVSHTLFDGKRLTRKIESAFGPASPPAKNFAPWEALPVSMDGLSTMGESPRGRSFADAWHSLRRPSARKSRCVQGDLSSTPCRRTIPIPRARSDTLPPLWETSGLKWEPRARSCRD